MSESNDQGVSFQFREIQSTDNPVFRDLKKAAINSHSDLCLVHGYRLLDSIPEARLKMILVKKSWWTSLSANAQEKLALEASRPHAVQRLELSDRLFDELNSANVPDCISVCSKSKQLSVSFGDLFSNHQSTLLITGRNPLNVGAQIRSAVAFGIETIALLKGSVSPDHSQVIRASAGASLRGHCLLTGSAEDLLEYCKSIDGGPSQQTQRLVVLDLAGTPLPRFRFPTHPVFLLGEEGPGLAALRGLKAGCRVTIPISNQVESLNLATATAIALYAWRSTKPPS